MPIASARAMSLPTWPLMARSIVRWPPIWVLMPLAARLRVDLLAALSPESATSRTVR